MEPSQDPSTEKPVENPEPNPEPKPSDLIEDYKEGEHDDKPHTDPNVKTEGTMRAAYIENYNQPLVVKQVPIPKPASGEVLIKVEAAPINPSDLIFITGRAVGTGYQTVGLPIPAGREGAGTVIASGGGLMARAMVGKRVAFGAGPEKAGSWGEYAVTTALQCIPLDKNITFEQGACAVVNPFTAVAFLEILKRDKAKAVVQQAAASQLGRMLVKMLKKEGIKTINIVRRPEQKKLLEELGADVVLNSEEKGFEEELKKKAQELHAVHLLECICGDVTTKVIKAMPRDSTCYIYGHLDKETLTDVDFGDILTNNKTIKPFLLPVWLNDQGIFTKVGLLRKVQKLLQSDLKTEIAKTFTVDQINEAIEHYKKNMTEGKIIVKPN